MTILANQYVPKDVFKFIRENTDLTQTEFGKQINRSQKTIQFYETGRLKFDFKFLLEIAQILKLKIIIEDKENNFKIIANNYQAHEIFKLIRQHIGLSQSKLSKVLNKNIRNIQQYEYNERNYNFELLLLIAKEFDLEIIIKDKEK